MRFRSADTYNTSAKIKNAENVPFTGCLSSPGCAGAAIQLL